MGGPVERPVRPLRFDPHARPRGARSPPRRGGRCGAGRKRGRWRWPSCHAPP